MRKNVLITIIIVIACVCSQDVFAAQVVDSVALRELKKWFVAGSDLVKGGCCGYLSSKLVYKMDLLSGDKELETFIKKRNAGIIKKLGVLKRAMALYREAGQQTQWTSLRSMYLKLKERYEKTGLTDPISSSDQDLQGSVWG